MRKISILLCLSVSLILISCKKDHSQLESISKFGFTANNVDYKWDFIPGTSFALADAEFRKSFSPARNDTIYVLAGINRPANIELQCTIHTSRLKASTYKTVTLMSDRWVESTLRVNGRFYGARTDDVITITIASIDRNAASGTFSAVMHDLDWGGLQELRVWNGYFNDVALPD